MNRRRTQHAEAFHIWDSKWVPPETLAFSTLPKLSRLSLMSVLNFLAFGTLSAPPIGRSGMYDPDLSVGVADMQAQIEHQHYLMCVAHRGRAFGALREATREGKVKLYGTPRTGGRRPIDPIEFDVPLSLADEDEAIGFDLDAAAKVSVERYVELRQAGQQWIWRDVHVDCSSLMQWLKKMPTETQRRAKADSVTNFRQWLVEERKSGPPTKRKADYKAEAKKLGVGPDQFRTAWDGAAMDCPNDDWGKPGRPPKKSSGK